MGIGGSARGCLGPAGFWRPWCLPGVEEETGNRFLFFAGLQTNAAACLENFNVSGMSCSRLPGCPHGPGSGHSLAHTREAAQEERAANEGKGCLPH